MKYANVCILSVAFLILLIFVTIFTTCVRCNCKPNDRTYEQSMCDACIHNDKVEVKTSFMGDRGVFARKDIKKGEIVERCPLIVDEVTSFPNGTTIKDYLFKADQNRSAVVFGYCSIYNHNTPHNVRWLVDIENNTMTMTAITDIKKGEEMFVTYGDEYWTSRNVVPQTYADSKQNT